MDGLRGETEGNWTESCLSGGDSRRRVGEKGGVLRVNGGHNVRLWSENRKLSRFVAFKANLFGEWGDRDGVSDRFCRREGY